jgi:hypothetical protein
MYHNQEVFWTFGMGRSASRGDPAPYMRGDISVCLYQKNSGKADA